MTLTSHTDDFGATLLESMDEAIRGLLSQRVLDALYLNLKNERSISREEIPDHLPTFCIVLEKYFGPSASIISRVIARKLYLKFGLDFQENENYKLADYVQIAKNKLTSTSSEHESSGVDLPSRKDFNQLLVISVREAIEDILGKDSAKSALLNLEKMSQLMRYRTICQLSSRL